LWEFIQQFVDNHNHAPGIDTLRLHFEETAPDPDVSNQLQIIRTLKPLFGGDFTASLVHHLEAQKTRQLENLLKTGNTINRTGLEVQVGVTPGGRPIKEIYKGPMDALRWIESQSPLISSPFSGIRKRGEVTSDGEAFLEDCDRRKDDDAFSRGQCCGIYQIDKTLGGAKKDQLWTHAGFTGHLKSALAFNWVYNLAIYYGRSSLFFSLEMPYDQCRRILYTMHSMHEKFSEVRVTLGIQEDPDIPTSLAYTYVRDGKLSEAEEVFLREYVVPDMMDPENGYGKILIEGYDPDSKTFKVSDIRTRGEILYRENPFHLVIVDHVLLVDPENDGIRGTTERANEVVRNLKKLSEIFNREGIAILALFQISREGVKRADKNYGRYSLYDLSYSNEIERSSDIVTAGYMNDELKNAARLFIQCLKSRDDAPFEPFFSRIEWRCRRIQTCFDQGEDIFELLASADTRKKDSRKNGKGVIKDVPNADQMSFEEITEGM
jgi:hypothetical protein